MFTSTKTILELIDHGDINQYYINTGLYKPHVLHGAGNLHDWAIVSWLFGDQTSFRDRENYGNQRPKQMKFTP